MFIFYINTTDTLHICWLDAESLKTAIYAILNSISGGSSSESNCQIIEVILAEN